MPVSQVIGFIKGKSAIHLARVYGENRRNFVDQSFRARGYFVSTVGRDEEAVRRYIQEQEKEDQRLDQLSLMPLWAANGTEQTALSGSQSPKPPALPEVTD